MLFSITDDHAVCLQIVILLYCVYTSYVQNLANTLHFLKCDYLKS